MPSPAVVACQQSTTDTARPPSDVSLYFAFISFAVSAIAVDGGVEIDAAIRRDLVARDHEAGPRLDRAERAALDARHLDEAGHRIARHAEVVLQRRLRRVGDDLMIEVVRLRDERRAHRRRHADLRLAAAFRARQRRVVLAQVADRRRREEAVRGSCPAAACGRLRRATYTSAGMTPAEPPVGAVTTRWPRAFSSEPASAYAATTPTPRCFSYLSSIARV